MENGKLVLSQESRIVLDDCESEVAQFIKDRDLAAFKKIFKQ